MREIIHYEYSGLCQFGSPRFFLHEAPNLCIRIVTGMITKNVMIACVEKVQVYPILSTQGVIKNYGRILSKLHRILIPVKRIIGALTGLTKALRFKSTE